MTTCYALEGPLGLRRLYRFWHMRMQRLQAGHIIRERGRGGARQWIGFDRTQTKWRVKSQVQVFTIPKVTSVIRTQKESLMKLNILARTFFLKRVQGFIKYIYMWVYILMYTYIHISIKNSTFDKSSVHYSSHLAKIPLPTPYSVSMGNGEEGNLLLVVNPTETEWESMFPE